MLQNQLLERLATLQTDRNGKQRAGLFPSYRLHSYLPYRRNDENIFFSASIIWILQEFKTQFAPKYQALIEEICQKVTNLYPFYRSRNQRPAYNFFENAPNKHFPHGWLIHRLKRFQVADDVDDTALIYLTKPHTHAEKAWVKQQLPQYANLRAGRIRRNLSHYRNKKIYSTFFGKKMYVEFDVAVLSNLMYWILQEDFPLDEYDKQSIEHLCKVVEREEWCAHTFEVAPSYPRRSHIAYNLARLFGAEFATDSMQNQRSQLAKKIGEELKITTNPLDSILFNNALLRLGKDTTPLRFTEKKLEQLLKEDLFYVSIWSLSDHPTLRNLDRWKFFQVRCNCPAWQLSLYLEHICLTKKHDTSYSPASFQV